MGTKLLQAYVDKASGETSFHQCSGMEKKWKLAHDSVSTYEAPICLFKIQFLGMVSKAGQFTAIRSMPLTAQPLQSVSSMHRVRDISHAGLAEIDINKWI